MPAASSGRVLLAAVVALLIALHVAAPAVAAPPASVRVGGSTVGRYIVTLADGEDLRGVRQRHRIARAAVSASYRSALRGFAARMPAAVAVRLAADPGVLRVEVDRPITVAATQYSPPWGLDRIDERELQRSGSYRYGSTGKGVDAYVVDSGVRRTHDEFGGRVATGWYDPYLWNRQGMFISSSADCNGHGTHVAGILAGRTYGVAKAARVVPVRVLDCEGGGYDSGVIAGLEFIIEHHVAGKPAVANLSLGGSAADAPEALEDAVRASIADGVTVVVAAGNGNHKGTPQNACDTSPARVPEVLTVGATDRYDERASFSNFGACVDVFAPGVEIKSAYAFSDGDTYRQSGTSMAAPHVAGAAARYLQVRPDASPADVGNEILNEATSGSVLDPGPESPNKLLYAEPPAHLALSVAPNEVTYLDTVTVTGQVIDDDGHAPEETVTLQRRRVGTTTWKTAGIATPGGAGEVWFDDAPWGSVDYRLRFAGGYEQVATSSRRRVGVHTLVTGDLSAASVSTGTPVTLSGQIRPGHPGSAVLLQAYRNGAWQTIRSQDLDEQSGYTFALDTSASGPHRYRAVKRAHQDHLRGVSPARTLTVG